MTHEKVLWCSEDASIRQPRNPEDLLIASTLSADGGLPVAVGRLAGALVQHGRRVLVIGPGAGADCPAITASGAAVLRLPACGGLTETVRAVQTCRQAVRRTACPDGRELCPIVHIHGIWTPPVIAAAREASRIGIPYIISPHGMLLGPALRKGRWRKRVALTLVVSAALTRARAVHCASEEEAGAVRRVAPGSVTRVIPFGVDLIPQSTERSSDRPQVAGYLGRLVAIKNLEPLVSAWADVRPAGWRLRIAGPDGDGTRARLEKMVGQLHLEGIVSVEQPVAATAVPEFLSSLAVFIQPSLSENFGMAIAEALAASTPVITTTGTPWHSLPDRRCGWSVTPSRAGLSTAIREATATPAEELAAMGRRGADWIAAEYSWSTVAPRFLHKLYELS